MFKPPFSAILAVFALFWLPHAHAGLDAYISDSCSKNGVQSRHYTFGKTSFTKKTTFPICSDRSVSFIQPESQGMGGYEGKCGEVAISNLLKMTCGAAWSPSGLVDDLTYDYTPGTAPDTMVDALNDLSRSSGCGGTTWTYYDTADSAEEYIESLVNGLKSPSKFTRLREDKTTISRAPVLALVYYPEEQFLHWITVVDVLGYQKGVKVSQQKNCKVVLNQWDDQYTVPCHKIAKMARDVYDAYYVAGWYLGKYVRIKQE